MVNKKIGQQSSGGGGLLLLLLLIILGILAWHYYGNQINNFVYSKFGLNLSNVSSTIINQSENFIGEAKTAFNIINNPSSYLYNQSNQTNGS